MVSRQESVDLINLHDEERKDISNMSIVSQENTGANSSQQSDLEDVDHLTTPPLPPQDSSDSSQSTVKRLTLKDSSVDHDNSEEEASPVPCSSNFINDRTTEDMVEGTDDGAGEQAIPGGRSEIVESNETSENGSRNERHENQFGDTSIIRSETDELINNYKKKMEQFLDTSHSEFGAQVDKTYDNMSKDVNKFDLNIIMRFVDEQLKEIFQTCFDHFIEIEQNLISEVKRLKECESKTKRDIEIAVEKKINKTLEHDKFTRVVSKIDSLITTQMNEYTKSFNKKVDQIEGKLEALEIAKPEDNSTTEIITNMEHEAGNWYELFDKRVSTVESAGYTIRENVSKIEAMLKTFQENLERLEESLRSLTECHTEKLNIELSRRINEVLDKITEVEKESYLLREDVENVKLGKVDRNFDPTEEELNRFESECSGLKDRYTKVLGTGSDIEEIVSSMEQRLRDEVNESVNSIVKRLEEDRAAKWEQIVEAVKGEANRVMEQIDILESVEGVLRQELSTKEKEIVKMIEQDRVTCDQNIQRKIRETIDSYSTEYDAKMKQQIREAMSQYEEKINKLADSSSELEQTFTGEIKNFADRRIHSVEVENNKLKDSKRHYKEKLVQRELEIHELKLRVNQYESQVCKIEQERTHVEKKINDMKLEKKQMESKVKDLEFRYHESDKRFQTKLMSSEDELRRIKIEYERQEKRSQNIESERVSYKKWFRSMVFFSGVLITLFTANFFSEHLIPYVNLESPPQ